MSAEERVSCLRKLEQADAVATVARTSVLGVFAAGQDYADDGDYSWTDKLPEDSRRAADEILLGAAASGLELADLAGLAAAAGQARHRSR